MREREHPDRRNGAADAGAPISAGLPDVVAEIAERVSRYRGTHLGEQNTKAALIVPVLRGLGWNVEDVEEVQWEYRRVSNETPVDYALMLSRTPRLFVEAKALDEHLEDRRWTNQVISYATQSGVEWVVLTNGDEYRLYNAHAAVPLEDKLFRSIRITDSPNHGTDALALLSREQTRAKLARGSLAYVFDRSTGADRCRGALLS